MWWRSIPPRCWGNDVGDGSLVFFRPHDGTGHLVFGDTGGAAAAPDAVIGLDAGLPGLDGAVLLRTGPALGLDADLPGLDGAVELLWDANVSRGGLRHELQACWQEAAPVAAGLQARWQEATALRAATQARWQQAQRTSHGVRAHWQDTERLRGAVLSRWQEGAGLRHGVVAAWQDTERLRGAVLSRWQEGAGLRHGVAAHWQEMHRMRAAVLSHWQEAAPLRAAVQARYAQGVPTRVALRAHWQEARRPPPGVSAAPPVEPPEPPCYDPATAGRLVFTDLALGDGRLVFVCQRGGGLPPATVVVLPRRSYIVVNSVEIRRADALAGDPLPSESFQMQLNRQSWTWSWSAAFHASARDALMPGLGGEPVELEVRVNGQPFRLLAERIGKSKRFPEYLVRVDGRGKAALLDPERGAVQTFSQALDRTAQQLMTEVLTVNGVGFGWSVDFQLTDWLVPGGVWLHQGTRISALADIASAVGGYLQPHDTDPVLRVLPGWPVPWWEWNTVAPDIELPAGVAEIEDTEFINLPDYDRIFVYGEAGGMGADLSRSGTSGTVLKQPMAVHPLITTMGAAKQRARAELSESGRALKRKMTLPVLPATGIIKPGTFVRYTDEDAAIRLGLVRATNVSMQFPVLTQALEVDSHE